jgi:hypothetical protein
MTAFNKLAVLLFTCIVILIVSIVQLVISIKMREKVFTIASALMLLVTIIASSYMGYRTYISWVLLNTDYTVSTDDDEYVYYGSDEIGEVSSETFEVEIETAEPVDNKTYDVIVLVPGDNSETVENTSAFVRMSDDKIVYLQVKEDWVVSTGDSKVVVNDGDDYTVTYWDSNIPVESIDLARTMLKDQGNCEEDTIIDTYVGGRVVYMGMQSGRDSDVIYVLQDVGAETLLGIRIIDFSGNDTADALIEFMPDISEEQE